MVFRIVNAVLGLWLVASALLWPHSAAQAANAIACGILVVSAAVAALRIERARYVNVALGAWLVISAFLLPTLRFGTQVNHVVVGTTVLALALIPTAVSRRPRLAVVGRGR